MLEFFRNKVLLNGEGMLTPEFVDYVAAQIEETVSGLNMLGGKITQLRLSTETILINWLQFYSDGQRVSYKLYRLWGKYYVDLRLVGEKHNPLLDSTLYGLPLEYEELIADIKSGEDICPRYWYQDGQNVVKIALPRKKLSSTTQTFIAIAAAVLTYGVCLLLPPEAGVYLAQEVFKPCVNVILGLIKMLSSVMIFTAMVTSICNMGSMRIFTKYGRAMLLHIQMCNFLAVFTGLCAAVLISGISIRGLAVDVNTLTPLIKVMVGMIPNNIVEPFATNNSTQILLMGAVVGCFFLTVREKVNSLFNGIKELHYTVMQLLIIICKFIPYVVYFSLAQMLINGSLRKIGLIAEVVVLYCSVLLVFVLLRLLYISQRTKVSLPVLLKSFSGAVVAGLTSASSMAMMPLIQIKCEQELKLHENFLNFALPLEMIMLKPLAGMYLIIMPLMVCQGYGVEISFSLLLSAGIMVALIASAIPPVPGGGIAVLTIIFNHFGLPQEAMTLPIAVDFVFDMLRTGFQGYSWSGELVLMDKKLYADEIGSR